MGDRCYVTLTVSIPDFKKHQTIFESHGYTDEEEVPAEGYTHLIFEEMNYGGEDMVIELEKLNVPFLLSNDAGASYPSGMVVNDGLERVYVDAVDGYPVVQVYKSQLDVDGLRDAYTFWRIHEKLFKRWRDAV